MNGLHLGGRICMFGTGQARVVKELEREVISGAGFVG